MNEQSPSPDQHATASKAHGVDLTAVAGEIDQQAHEIVATGRWSMEREQELDALFARASSEALRAAAFTERSVVVRSMARHMIPRQLRPYVVRGLRATHSAWRAMVRR